MPTVKERTGHCTARTRKKASAPAAAAAGLSFQKVPTICRRMPPVGRKCGTFVIPATNIPMTTMGKLIQRTFTFTKAFALRCSRRHRNICRLELRKCRIYVRLVASDGKWLGPFESSTCCCSGRSTRLFSSSRPLQ